MSGAYVITGAGDGMGRAIALELSARGPVAVVDIREDAAESVAGEIVAKGGQASAHAVDISDKSAVENMADSIFSEHGQVNHLWAHAGVGIAGGFVAAKEANLDWMLSVNVWGTLHTVRAFLPRMLERGAPAKVIVTASSASLIQLDLGTAAYGASKHMSMGIAEGLLAELEGTPIDVSVFCPGLVNTRIWDGARARPERFGGARTLPEDVGEPWKEGLDPNQVANDAINGVDAGKFYVIVPYSDTRQKFDARINTMSDAFP